VFGAREREKPRLWRCLGHGAAAGATVSAAVDQLDAKIKPSPSDRDPAVNIRRKRFGVELAKESLGNFIY